MFAVGRLSDTDSNQDSFKQENRYYNKEPKEQEI